MLHGCTSFSSFDDVNVGDLLSLKINVDLSFVIDWVDDVIADDVNERMISLRWVMNDRAITDDGVIIMFIIIIVAR